MRGFSPRNLKYMRALAQAFPQPEFVQQPVAQLPWSHVVTLLDKLDDAPQRLWYAEKSLEHGWSRSVLIMQIETVAHSRAGNAVTNFADHLPSPQSDLARDALKDPYIFDFLGLTESAQERDIERILLELGAGFARWAPIPAGNRRRRVLHRSDVLAPEAEMLRGCRSENDALQTRIRRAAQLLSVRN
ncbi:hypothetical protein PT2222_450023 [Paraburkholderia tropica]